MPHKVKPATAADACSLAAVRRDGRRIGGVSKVRESAMRQLELARVCYESGQGQILDVLNAERALFDARAQVAAATRRHASSCVRLNVAIGGGVSAMMDPR